MGKVGSVIDLDGPRVRLGGMSKLRLGFAFAGIVALTLASSSRAGAEPANKTECASAYEKSQEFRASGKLKSAMDQLHVCAQETCPAFVQSDCAQWLTEVQRDTPTVVFAAKDQHGEDTVAVRVLSDGEEIAKELEGRAIPIDPGPHKLRFELTGADPIEQQVVIRQGQKDRVIAVSFAPQAADIPVEDPYAGSKSDQGQDQGASQTSTKPSSVRLYSYVAGGVGAAGLLTFAVLGTVGHGEKSSLESSGCSPNCSQDKVDSIKTKYLLADVGLGVGVAGLGAGVVLFLLSQPKQSAPPTDQGTGINFDFKAAPGVAFGTASGRF